MPQTIPVGGPEPPLDPAMERLRLKLRRLLFWSTGIMALGLVAVFSVIAYRLVKPERASLPALDAPLVAAAEMPRGGRVVAATLAEGRLLVTIQGDAGGAVLVVDLATLQVVRRLELTPGR